MKTPDDFREQAIKERISEWRIHDCGMCKYKCGFLFFPEVYEVMYDKGCNCVSYNDTSFSSWEAVANHYNLQTNKDVINKYNEFWGFTNNKD